MQLTRYTDNALRVLMFLALKSNRLSTIPEISKKFSVSKNHLMKIVNELVNRGYITSIQGRGGGIKLALSPDEITVGMIVRDMESTLDLIDCETKPCPIISACKLKDAVNDATEGFLLILDKYTIAQLIKPKSQRSQLVKLLA